MTVKKAVTVRSPTVSSTGAVSAGNPVTLAAGASDANVPGGAPVVAPKGFRLQLSQMLAGWEQVIPAGSVVTSRGGTLAQATILAQLEAFMADYTSLDSAELALKTARVQEAQALPAAKALLAQLKEALTSLFGANSPQLARFGMKPKTSRKPLSAEKAAVRLAKLRNTRAIRGTMGKVQKADLKSGPMTVTVAPAASPVASTVAPAVASAAAPAVAQVASDGAAQAAGPVTDASVPAVAGK